ncbi:C-1-tetrahydrofolate synthase, cytoplasmic isoform X1 [Tribolium madens]|uniref:C-1-tetrahydrofolate synthase, cytoplasmic isoform X1 n=2 Tax=Tribolium madens TaxID=41895 RepID=UPI001CF72C09|nr:C-1-tetrahydrofolate synthase, cytoplasmic isoform X1 [Tribolium madens]
MDFLIFHIVNQIIVLQFQESEEISTNKDRFLRMASTDVIGQVLSGTLVAKQLTDKLTQDVARLKQRLPGFEPGLAIVQVGGREDSNVYIRMKIKTASQIGIKALHVKLPQTTTEGELLSKLEALNDDPNIHGIIVQMPLDSTTKIDSHLITDAVSPEKDVDGLNTLNEGRTAVGDLLSFIPCTPNGIMELIRHTGIKVEGAEAVVLGRSKIVGTPVGELLKWAHATVTICHSRTKNLEETCKRADILVVAVGKPGLVKGSWVKKGAVVIDCGINAIPDPTKKSGQKLVGDVDYESASKVASYITPVPGGVGPMTVAMLMKNTVQSAQKAVNTLLNAKWNLRIIHMKPQKPVPRDIDIARAQQPVNIQSLAQDIGLYPSEIIPYGNTKAKISLSVLDRLSDRKNAKYIAVVGMTPTPLGEGKTTVSVGLAQALCAHKGYNAIVTLRQPSLGPTFGIKGGAAGGGYAQVIPMEDFNLHLTGDIHAITAANNLLAAQIDARIFHEATQTDTALFDRLVPTLKGTRKFSPIQLRRLKRLGINKTDPNSLTPEEKTKFARLDIDPKSITWKRVLDISDRHLRKVTIGQSPTEKGLTRETSFTIAVASEFMAILALAADMQDLKKRVSNVVIGFNKKKEPVTVDDLGATGAVTVLLKDAMQPNLMQTLEGTPVLVHAGPFANIAHGCSSVVGDKIAFKLAGESGYVITEGGFGSDIGMEKLFDIKCRTSGDAPDCVVLVATIRALKMHGGGPAVTPGAPLKPEYTQENVELLEKGLPNLIKHISNGRKFGLPVVVCINQFENDTEAEIQLVQKAAKENGAFDAVLSNHWAEGGAGSVKLAEAVVKACQQPSQFKLLYDLNKTLDEKIQTIAREMYGAGKVTYTPEVSERLKLYEERGYGKLPICMAKTSMSFTGDPSIKGAPTGFELKVSDISVSVGAGFVVPIAGEISTMPGLPTRPALYDIDYNIETGEIEGLF